MIPFVAFEVILYRYQGMLELTYSFGAVLNRVQSYWCFVSFRLNFYLIYFPILMEAGPKHFLRETQSLPPTDIEGRYQLIVLLNSDTIKNFILDILSLLSFLHFFLEKLFPFFQLFLHLSLSFQMLLLPSFQVLSKFFPLLVHAFAPFSLLLDSFDIGLVDSAIFLQLQILVGLVDFQEH